MRISATVRCGRSLDPHRSAPAAFQVSWSCAKRRGACPRRCGPGPVLRLGDDAGQRRQRSRCGVLPRPRSRAARRSASTLSARRRQRRPPRAADAAAPL